MTHAGPLGSSYHLESLLGRGASGEVWRGRDDQGRPWAFKILRPELVSDSGVLRRFIQERDVLASIRHPNVVQVHDLVLDGSSLAIVVDLVEGMDLKAVLRSQGTLPPARVARIGAEVAAALAAAHALGVVHRDVKPENVLMPGGEEGQARLTDFGVAKLIDDAGESTMVVGTPQYMPPEFGEGHPPTAAGDLYSLGIMLYELLCGVTPFAGRGPAVAVLRAHALETPGRPGGIPGPLWDIVAELTEKAPNRRPQAAAVVAERLAALVGPLADTPAAPALTDPPPTTPAADGTLDGDETRLRPAFRPQASGSGPYPGAPYGAAYLSGHSRDAYSGDSSSGGSGGSGGWSSPHGWVPGGLPPGTFPPPGQAQPSPARPRRSSAVVVALAVCALVLVVGAVFAIDRLRAETTSAAGSVTENSTPAPGATQSPERAATGGATPAPVTSTMVVTVTGQPSAPRVPAAPPLAATSPAEGREAGTDPGLRPGPMVTGMPGTSCAPTSQSTGYGAYTRSMCDNMRRYVGQDGAILEAGRTWVVCQRDLGIANPVYRPGQTNTWWFFTRSDNRRWAWFPQTLLKQGTADRPINGIPLCG